jgi:hypothetical protein
MKSEKITWKTMLPEPGEFRCLICNDRDAERMAHPVIKGIKDVNLPVCLRCSALSDIEVDAILKSW